MLRARAISWGPHVTSSPPIPVLAATPPAFLASVGQAVRGLLKRALGDSAVFNEWQFAEESSRSTSLGSFF